MPFLEVRWSTSTQPHSCARRSAIAPVPSGEPSSTTSTLWPSGLASASTSPAARTIGSTFSASLYVGSISQGGPDMGRRTLKRERAQPCAYPDEVAKPELPNVVIAEALEELGDLYELDGAIVHRVVAYRTAARTVREAPVSVAALARTGRASELPGIGATLQENIVALLDGGTIPKSQ